MSAWTKAPCCDHRLCPARSTRRAREVLARCARVALAFAGISVPLWVWLVATVLACLPQVALRVVAEERAARAEAERAQAVELMRTEPPLLAVGWHPYHGDYAGGSDGWWRDERGFVFDGAGRFVGVDKTGLFVAEWTVGRDGTLELRRD